MDRPLKRAEHRRRSRLDADFSHPGQVAASVAVAARGSERGDEREVGGYASATLSKAATATTSAVLSAHQNVTVTSIEQNEPRLTELERPKSGFGPAQHTLARAGCRLHDAAAGAGRREARRCERVSFHVCNSRTGVNVCDSRSCPTSSRPAKRG